MLRNLLIFFVALITAAISHAAWATMLIVVYTDDGYWIGADSTRTIGDTHSETVCKIHETKFGVLLKGGPSQGTTINGDLYSTDNEVEGLLANAASPDEFKSNLSLKIKQDIEAELIYLINDPKLTRPRLAHTLNAHPIPSPFIPALTRDFLLFDYDGPQPRGEALIVKPQSTPIIDPISGTKMYLYSGRPAVLWIQIDHIQPQYDIPEQGKTVSFPNSVRMFGYAIQYEKPDGWVRSHPKEAITEMLQTGHAEEPDHIGPPYAIMHVILRGKQEAEIQWIEKGACPAWNEAIHPESSLKGLRNP